MTKDSQLLIKDFEIMKLEQRIGCLELRIMSLEHREEMRKIWDAFREELRKN